MAIKNVVQVVINRLKHFDTQAELRIKIGQKWLPVHFRELREKYPNQLIALWHQPRVKIIAHGHDAFELENNLKEWRNTHHAEQPYILRISSVD